MRGEQATISGQQNSLDAIIRNHSYSTDTVRKLLRPDSLGPGRMPLGTLADFLEVSGEREAIADEFLREELSYIVVKSWQEAEDGIQLLRSGLDGRATFLVRENHNEAIHSAANTIPEEELSGIVALRETIQIQNGFSASIASLLPKLRNGYLAADVATARSRSHRHPEGYFLAPTGECFHSGTVSGGKPAAGGPLALKRELLKTQRQLETVEEQLRIAENDALSAAHAIDEIIARVEDLSEQRRVAEREAANQSAALKQIEHEAKRIERLLLEAEQQRQRNRDAQQQKQAQIASKLEQAARLESDHQSAETALETLIQGLSEMRGKREAAQQEAARVTAELAGLEERRRGAESTFQRIDRLHSDLERRLLQLDQQRAAALAEREQRTAENERLHSTQSELRAAREQAMDQARSAQEEVGALRARLSAIEQQLKSLRARTDALRETRSLRSNQSTRLKSDLEHLEASCLNELGLEAAVLRSEPGLLLLDGEALDAEEELCRALRQRLEAMGPVNMMALEEFQETAQRHDFLETQRKDLIDSIENTHNTIREIDQISRTKFDEAFVRINENFGNVFSRLFNGGQAFLRLTDAENQAESGLEIVASPPGKKLQNVLLLSGGEKALTALSLLVGIFQFQPAPFCVLDEVDAALDETNVGRLADLLRGLAQDTQFLLVTHSKRMMQTANMIYGVTMQEPGVSRIVSVHMGGRDGSDLREIKDQQRASA